MKMQMSLLLILSWISVAVAHAAQPSGNDVSARVFNSTDVNVSSLKPGEWMSLTFDSERWDTANLHETKNNSGRLTASVAGKYYIFANITWESPIGSGLWGLRLRVNGKTVIAEQSLPNTGAPFRISMSVGTLYALASHFPSAEAFPDCILLDIQLSGMSGFELEDRLASFGSTIPVIFITAHDDPEAIEQARQTGCIAYLRKNDPAEMVLEAIRRAVKRVE